VANISSPGLHTGAPCVVCAAGACLVSEALVYASPRLKCEFTVKDNRPVNLDITSMRLPITAWVSIAHRASGAFLIVGVGLLLWMLDVSLASAEGFACIQGWLSGTLAKLVVWLVLSALAYHTFAGIKHLVMDVGIGETMAGGILGARIVIVVTLVSVVLLGAWIW
jgi:succinate dehydrogenase / fumarate reductase cytochrome b subunit